MLFGWWKGGNKPFGEHLSSGNGKGARVLNDGVNWSPRGRRVHQADTHTIKPVLFYNIHITFDASH